MGIRLKPSRNLTEEGGIAIKNGGHAHTGSGWRCFGHRRSSGRDRPRSCFHLCVALSEGGCFSVGHRDPRTIRRGLGVVVVVPVPPLVRRSLGVTLWRVLPGLLTAERCDVEVAPGCPHGLIAAAV